MKEEIIENILNNMLSNPINGLRPALIGQYNSLATYLLQPTITPKDLGLSYATIKYWEAKNYLLLPTIKDADEWRKYTVIEALWFALLKHVVDMGCSLDKVAPQLLFAYANFKSPNSTTLFNADVPPLMVINGIRVSPFVSFINHTLLIILGKAKASINLNNTGVSLVMDRGGDIAEVANSAFSKQFASGITICISDIIYSAVLGSKPALNQTYLFSNADMAVFNALKNPDVGEINVKQSKGKIYQVATVENLGLKDAALPLNKFVQGLHQTVEVKSNDTKKQVFVKVTKKQKF